MSPPRLPRLPTARSLNAITGANWHGTGVRPDIEVEADSALAVALRLIADRRRAPTASP
jgi:hypothetical protein